MNSPFYNHEPFIPNGIGEINDMLSAMILGAPTFEDKSGYFPDRNAETEFFALNEGLRRIQRKIGDERYLKVIELSNKAKAHFQADPEDKTEDGIKGRDCLMDIQETLRDSNRRQRRSILP